MYLNTDKILLYLRRKRSSMEPITDIITNSSSSKQRTRMVTKDERIIIEKEALIVSYDLRNKDIIEAFMNFDNNIDDISYNDRLRSCNYMEFIKDITPSDMSRNISIYSEIRIKFGPNSNGLVLFTPALVDMEAMKSFILVPLYEFNDDDFKTPHFTIVESNDENKDIQQETISLICESCRFKHTKVFITCEVCGAKNTYRSTKAKNPTKFKEDEDDENEKIHKVEKEKEREKKYYDNIRPGDMKQKLGNLRQAKSRGFKQWTTKKFQSRIHLLELTEKHHSVDILIEKLEGIRYSNHGINDGYSDGDEHSWQRYTSIEPTECRITLIDEYDIFSTLSDNESMITLKPYEPLKCNTTYLIYLGNSTPIVPPTYDALYSSYNASHVCEDKLFIFTTAYE